MKTRHYIILLICLISSGMQLLSQDIKPENLRDTLFKALVSTGDFEEGMMTQETILIINDIVTLKHINEQEYGVFMFGTLTSHSYFHILLRDKDAYVIIDMKQSYEKVILKILDYFRQNNLYSKEEILLYFTKVTELYKKNQENIPWELTE
ncbi:MAG: hypothetical protein M0Q41_00025 [Bacteroidales bacterium]|nr:hypothetical protein [Bacteroidales bacterium]